MVLSRSQVVGLISPQPCWCGFDDFVYEFYIVPATWGLTNLHTCCKPRDTFIRIAASKLGEVPTAVQDDTTSRIIALADTFDNRPLLIPAFVHRDLKISWPEEYPAASPVPDDALIAEDGNKRLTALAVRLLRRQTIVVSHIGLFVGYLRLPGNIG